VFSHITINFSKFEDLEAFEAEYKQAVEAISKPPAAK